MKNRIAPIVLALLFPFLFFAIQLFIQFAGILYVMIAGPGDYDAAVDKVMELFPWLFVLASACLLLVAVLILRKDGAVAVILPYAPGMNVLFISILLGLLLSMFTTQFLEIVPLPESWIINYEEMMEDFDSSMSIGALLTYSIILAPIMEEVAFRGLSLGLLKKAMPLWLAVIVQAVMFAGYHGNMVQFIYALIPGLALGFIVAYTHSIWCGIAAHAMFNSSGFFIGDWVPLTGFSGVCMAVFLLSLSVVGINMLYRKQQSVDQ